MRRVGYGKYPGDSRDYEQYVLCIDGEASVHTSTDEGEALLRCARTGPWMAHLSLTKPALALFEVHLGSTTTAQSLHRDWGETRLFNVIVPLNDDSYGATRGGTTCVHWDGDKVCKPGNLLPDLGINQFVVFPAHVPHHRTAASTPEMSRRRRVAILQFCESESLARAWPAVEAHRKQHARAKRRRYPWPQSASPRAQWIHRLRTE